MPFNLIPFAIRETWGTIKSGERFLWHLHMQITTCGYETI